MKVIILSGGLGSRLGLETERIPKPMVEIGSMPIIVHIMKIYSHFGYNEFILALGYKAEIIRDYFSSYQADDNWKINCIDTGLNTSIAKRMHIILNQKRIDNDILFKGIEEQMRNTGFSNESDIHRAINNGIIKNSLTTKDNIKENTQL